MSRVSAIPAASPDTAIRHFADEFMFETDCSDVHDAIASNNVDFVLLDVRGPELLAAAHIPGAINLPRSTIDAGCLAAWPEAALFVVYRAGPHCNGAACAALRLARLGRAVKLMASGITGWADEGFALERAPFA